MAASSASKISLRFIESPPEKSRSPSFTFHSLARKSFGLLPEKCRHSIQYSSRRVANSIPLTWNSFSREN